MPAFETLSRVPAWRRIAGDNAAVLTVFTGTLFLSALLLFSVQPMFTKLVLPRLGGSPSVWAVAMCFFQAVLLLGYCYAHLLGKFLSPRLALACHLAVCASAFIALPLALPDNWDSLSQSFTHLWLLGLFAVAVGLPFFAVSANAPLLQAWFSKTGHPQSSDPYFLYGASNIGSLIALLGYPVLIEPFVGLSNQSLAWTAGFTGLIALIAMCGVLMISGRPVAAEHASGRTLQEAGSISWQSRAQWTALAFVPSGLLVAFSTHITTDVASAPFLWVIPLALYLLTYILVFRDRPLLNMKTLLILQPVFVGAALLTLMGSGLWIWVLGTIAGTGAFFTTAMICHRTLYEQRPDASRLTEFYLWMSFGGVLGGIFTALLAPVLFSLVIEYPLLLALGLLCRKDALQSVIIRELVRTPLLTAAVAIAAFALAKLSGTYLGSGGGDSLRALVIAVIAGFAFAASRHREHLICLAAGGLCVVLLMPGEASNNHVERSFFGVHRVLNTTDGKYRLLSHGTTVHGAERLVDDNGQPMQAPVPATYYYAGGPMAGVLDMKRNAAAPRPVTVGIVGLGAGALACHARPAEDWKFFEIDPAVISIAQNPKHFTYMSRCQPGKKVIVGDARLTLQKQDNASFDYLVIDAFSSDSIPVHLITVEALRLFLEKVAEDGVLVLHVSNRYLDLEPVLEAAVASMGVHGVAISDHTGIGEYDAVPSQVVVISRKPQKPETYGKWKTVRLFGKPSVPAWTDDYSNILSALLRKFTSK